MPVRVLWGAHGTVGKCFDVLAEWRRVAADVSGHALDCGHYLAEEQPGQVVQAMREAFGALNDGKRKLGILAFQEYLSGDYLDLEGISLYDLEDDALMMQLEAQSQHGLADIMRQGVSGG